MKSWSKIVKRTIVVLLLLALLGWIFWGKKNDSTAQVTEVSREVSTKNVTSFTFGSWDPISQRKILATVESDSEVPVVAEASGTLEQVNVRIGDRVNAGQLLARYRTGDDPLQIQLQNAQISLQSTQFSAQNSIQQAEIALQNAKAQEDQTKNTEAQRYQETFDALRSTTVTTKSSFSNLLDSADRYLGASQKFRYDDVYERSFIGNKNTILKNRTKNTVEKLQRDFLVLEQQILSHPGSNNTAVLNDATDIVAFGEKLQRMLFDLGTLSRNVITSQAFSVSQQQAVSSDVERMTSTLNNELAGIDAQIQSAKTVNQQIKLTLQGTNSQIKNAQANLELAKASAQSQIAGAQNQVRSAQNAQSDLTVRAPFSGTIVEKQINSSDRVSPGQTLFVILNEDQSKKAVAFLSLEEWKTLQTVDSIDLVTARGDTFTAQKSFISSKLDPTTQKIRAEILLPQSDILVGSFITCLLPLAQSQTNLVPLSAVSFEPDGAEVLTIDNENRTQRQKITYRDIIADSLEVLDGITDGDRVITYYNRVSVGELVNPE